MAKKALLDVLEQTIGKYVQNLDAESLNVAVWSGKIALTNLELDVDAVNAELDRQAAEAPNLAVPLQVIQGKFESLQVDVPWASLSSRSVVLRAQGLHVHVRPYDRLGTTDYLQASVASEEARAEKIRSAREQSIQLSEKYRQQAVAVRKLATETEPNKQSFSSRLVRRILENIQIEIQNVHITLTDAEGSAGIVLESLSLVTTDKDGKRVFVDRTSGHDQAFLYKMLLLDGLGIYLDHPDSATEKFVTCRTTLAAISETRSIDHSSSSLTATPPHSYVLAPLSFQAKLRQADGQSCVEYAKYQLSSELSSLSILLSRKQLELARQIAKEISKSQSSAPCPVFPEYRPLTRVNSPQAAREWWKYAVRSIGRLNGRRSWVEFFYAYQKRKQYIPLYKRQAHHATCTWMKPLNNIELETLIRLEQDRTISVEGLMAWRNIADGQVEKELQKRQAKLQEKKESTSYFSSIFGSKVTTETTSDEEPPIHLSLEELKELEDMSKEQFEDPELSLDSKLCDVQFVLNALKINLTSYDYRHLAALEMGAVSVAFAAAANGAFQFEFDLAALEIQDRVTTNSLFPHVLKSLQSETIQQSTAFHLHLSKTKTGDQTLRLQLAALEAVASHLLLKELQHFIASSSTAPLPTGKKKNPILAQSLSGSIDLFYDADQGASTQLQSPSDDTSQQDWNLTTSRGADIVARNQTMANKTTTDLSNALVEAWKEKAVTKASWVIDIDIQAPILLIPEKCNDPRASVLVFDLGHFKLKYGKIESSPRVLTWFQGNPRPDDDVAFDSGSLAINDLTFQIARASDWRLSSKGNSTQGSSVIDPMSLSLDLGVETVAHSGEPPRVCCIGVIPTISLRMSPNQGTKIVAVIASWTELLADSSDDTADLEATMVPDLQPDNQNVDPNSATSGNDDDLDEGSLSDVAQSLQRGSEQPQFYFLIGLQRLSVTMSLDSKNQIEAHLVSVFTSFQLMMDGSTLIGLRMGWFWILDMLESSYARRQRLLAHSNLPRSPVEFAKEHKYDILEELRQQGAFDPNFAGSTELADISYRTIGTAAIRAAKRSRVKFVASTLDATFSTLFIHWNPHAVKGVSNMMERFSTLADEYDDATTLIMSPEKTTRARKSVSSFEKEHQPTLSQMRINARMHRLDLNLNSALDDLPLFVLTVAETEVNMLSSPGTLQASLSLGDIRVRTPEEMGRTLSSYRTLLGLAPGRTGSLLTVKYTQGKVAIDELNLEKGGNDLLEAFAEVELSPMRLCFIQSQVMALVEYSTEGILGALTAKAASSAAQRAIELADAVTGEKLFRVKATSFDLVLPQAAHSENTLCVHAGSLDVEYFMFGGTGGSKANVELSKVTMHDTDDELLQEEPIRMSLQVILPSDEIGTVEEQAMVVDIFMSDASFLISRAHYLQVLQTLNENTSEVELFLRDDDSLSTDTRDVSPVGERTAQRESTGVLTHAGNEFVEKQRRMNLNVKIRVLALQLCDFNLHPIVRIAAVNAAINFQSQPDILTKVSTVSLQNLVCEDLRAIASQRQYRHLIRQGHTDSDAEDLFCIAYKSSSDETSLELKVGSPQVVLIPDAISDVLKFVKSDSTSAKDDGRIEANEKALARLPQQEILRLTTSGISDEVEMTLVQAGPTSTSRIAASTNTCRIVLVDLGSQQTQEQVHHSQLMETLVLQGIFSASLSSTSDLSTGKTINADFIGQCDSMEIFSAFGKEMQSPLQILEPSEGSLHGSMKTLHDTAIEIEIRAAALTPFDFTLSMHNAALLSAIVNSLNALFISDDGGNDPHEVDLHSLTEGEAEHIENLGLALAATSDRGAIGYSTSTSSVGDTSAIASTHGIMENASGTKIQLKMTLPEMKMTVINDLQGLDEALFRASVTNFVASVQVNRYGFPDMTFDFQVNTSILADYFDTSCSIWNNLLVQPWEITLKGLRAPSHRFKSDRLSTTIDLESFPCCVSFSEQFLVSLASASRMWSIYSVATAVHMEDDNVSQSGSLKASMAASAARNLVTSMPYAIENHTGMDVYFALAGGQESKYCCSTGSIEYFRFEPPRGRGYGGRRAYGQDLSFEKSVTIYMPNEHVITIGHLDYEFGLPRKTHRLNDGNVILTHVVKEGKTTVLHLHSHVSVINNTSLHFQVSMEDGTAEFPIGICYSHNLRRGNDTPLKMSENGIASKESKSFSVPIGLLAPYHRKWSKDQKAGLYLSISPLLAGEYAPTLRGIVSVSASLEDLKKSNDGTMVTKFDVICSPTRDQTRVASPLIVQVVLKTRLTDEFEAQMDVCLEPRALIENRFPIKIHLRTPMPHTFSSSPHEELLGKDVVYDLDTGDCVEVFTPGPSIAITVKAGVNAIAGSDLDWLDCGWIDLPLISEFSLLEPLQCLLPFRKKHGALNDTSGAKGSEFFIVEGSQALLDLVSSEENKRNATSSPQSPRTRQSNLNPEAPLRTFFATVCYYGIDHTGDVLFEQVSPSDPVLQTTGDLLADSKRANRRHSSIKSASHSNATPFSAFVSTGHDRRITLLPNGNVPLRILQMTMEGEVGFRRSLPFFVEELPIGDGGIDTIPIMWENQCQSGFYAYRSIVNDHQSEVHIVPEFLIFNGSSHLVIVHERGQPDVVVEGEKVSSLGVDARQAGLEIALYFMELDCRTSFMRVDSLGMKMVLIKSNDEVPVGSVCVQTVIDTMGGARLVVKIGEIDTGNLGDGLGARESGLFRDDFFRIRVRWTELQLILNELQMPEQASWSVTKALRNITPSGEETRKRPAHELPTKIAAGQGDTQQSQQSRFNLIPAKSNNGSAERRPRFHEILQQPVATIIFSRFTFDFQRVFKDQQKNASRNLMESPERSQIALIVHNVIVKDLTPDSVFPMVFDSSSPHCSFLDLCIRIRGPLDADMVKVDLFDLNLAYANGVTEKIKLTTSEDYVWRLIDLANRIMSASGDFAGYTLNLEEDKEHGGFIVKIEDTSKAVIKTDVKYTPPRSDTLYDIDVARVSPFCLLVSFIRNPQIDRYKKVNKRVNGSALMNYFSRKLKFTIDRAELHFARYEDRSLKGPPDRLIESLMAVYVSRMKFKLVTLLTAASLKDWKYLAARGTGDDEFVEGDILRATGNLTGKASHLIFKRIGETLGEGVSDFSRAIGNTIETTSDKIGAGRVGVGLNSVVTGVGDGVGSALSGVSNGTGKIFRGAGQGIGHAVGGVTGGALQIGKGIGKGLAKGDGKAVIHGFSQGLTSVGGGLATGAESVVVGTADGLLSAGYGLFSGVKNVGKGIGGAFTGKKPERKDRYHDSESPKHHPN